jgi:UPF0042 nucleotide-binding protein
LSETAARQYLVVVSGLSGGGKSTALHALEDLGFYCVDNLPAVLLKEFAREMSENPGIYSSVALGIDARSRSPELAEIPEWLEALKQSGLHCQLLFLTADDKDLIKRFSETRRRHPLTSDTRALPRAIELESEMLESLRGRADWVIDTSDTNIHELRRQVWKCVGGDSDSTTIVLESFAFKRGVPQDVDFVFDARNLANPHWVDELRNLTGLDPEVQDWLEGDEKVNGMFEDIEKFLLVWLPEFRDSQRSYVTVGIGCTGGRHRSVYLVDRLAKRFGDRFERVITHHRELKP